MINAYAEWVIRWRYLVLLATLVLIGLAGSGGRFLGFTSDYRVFFGADNPELTAFETLQNTYTKNDNVLFVLAPRSGDVFTPEVLAVVEQLTEKAWQLPFSIRVDSLSNFQHTEAEGDDLIVADLYQEGADLTPQALARVKAIALAEPLLVNRIVSPSGHVTGVNVTIQLPGKNQAMEVPVVVRYAREIAADLRASHPDIDVHLTGMVMMNNAFPEASQGDMQTLVPAMFAVVVVAIGLLLRVISGTFATVVVIILSIVGAMGLTGWLGIELTPPSSAAPTIILTLAIADCVHVLVSFLYGLRLGHDKHTAMVESLRINAGPVFLTSLTTAIGFLSMNFSDAPPFRDLGNIVAMGVVIAWILSMTLLPALMMVLPVRVTPGRTAGHIAMDRLSEFVIRRRKALFWALTLVMLGLSAMIPRNELNDQFVEYFDTSVEFRRASDFASANLTGFYTIDYSLRSDGPGGISEPAFLNKVEEFAEWFRQQPGVIHVNTLTDIMKRLNKNLHGDDPTYYRIPRERELAAQYLLLYEMSLPYGLDLNNQINVDKSATRFNVTLRSMTSNELLSLERRAGEWLRANAPASMHVQGASPAVMFAHIGERNIRSMLGGTTLALVLISLSLIIAFRSVKFGLMSMIPNLVPAALAFGLWGVFVGQVGLALSVVIGMTLGIVVDDTIHFLSKYLRARREKGLPPEDAVRYAFSTVGTALWVTTLVLVAGFLVLASSTFELNESMGLMTAITIALALTVDFLFLPPLLLMLKKERSDADAARDPAAEPAGS